MAAGARAHNRPPPARPRRVTSPRCSPGSDAQWKERDQPGKLDEIRAELTKAEKLAPDDYGVLWRLARLDFWISDDPSLGEEERSQLGKRAWEYGDRAAKVNPDGVEGWYFGALGMGNYSLGIGILKALGQGVEGKFRERLGKAETAQSEVQRRGDLQRLGPLLPEAALAQVRPEEERAEPAQGAADEPRKCPRPDVPGGAISKAKGTPRKQGSSSRRPSAASPVPTTHRRSGGRRSERVSCSPS